MLFRSAQVLLEENFNYELGDLEGQGGWTVSTDSRWNLGNSPVVIDGALSYQGYIGSGQGKSVTFSCLHADGINRISYKQLSSSGINSGSVYAAFLSKIDTAGTNIDFIMFDSGTGTSVRAKLGVTIEEEYFKFGICMNSSGESGYSGALNFGEIYLLVLKYTFVEGSKNDEVCFYVNPVPGSTEASQAAVKVSPVTYPSADSDISSIKNIVIRHRSTITGTIGAVRVGTTWEDVVVASDDGGNTNINSPKNSIESPVISINEGVLKIDGGDVQYINIYNVAGNLQKFGNENNLSVSELPKGIYILRCITSKGTFSQKIKL